MPCATLEPLSINCDCAVTAARGGWVKRNFSKSLAREFTVCSYANALHFIPPQLHSFDRRPGLAFAAVLQLGALMLLLWLSQDADAHRRFHGHAIPCVGQGSPSHHPSARVHVGRSHCGHSHPQAPSPRHSVSFGSGDPCGSAPEDEDAGCVVQLFALGQMALFTLWCELPAFEIVELAVPLPPLVISPAGRLRLLPFSCGPPLPHPVSCPCDA